MIVLRERFKDDLIPAFQDLAEKYAADGVTLHMDVALFLSGGHELLIDVQFGNHGIRLLGTVLPNRIAFQKTQYMNNLGAAMTSGPTLRTRDLTREEFREFVCSHISELVRSSLRRNTPNGSL